MERNRFARGEFMEFIDAFMNAHPEVVEDQKHGWDIYWNPEMAHRDELEEESVEDVLAEEMQP